LSGKVKKMHERQNYLDVNKFLEYQKRTRRNDPKTINRIRGLLRHLLIWADDIPFSDAGKIKNNFHDYISTARNDGQKKTLMPATIKKVYQYSRLFFEFCKRTYSQRYRHITEYWLSENFTPPKRLNQSEYIEHEFYTLDEINQIAQMPVDSIRLERDRAGAVFLYLSGMRVDAFVSMPVKAFDPLERKVLQFSKLGVRTKNGKPIITTLLDIPELYDLVLAWHDKVKKYPDSMWYGHIDRGNEKLLYIKGCADSRRLLFSRGLKEICGICGISYKSPHKFRHGHIAYAMSGGPDLKTLKAISQNVGHSSIAITDSLYGNLKSGDVAEAINAIRPAKPEITLDERLNRLEKMLTNNQNQIRP
jgi:integrase